MNGELFEKVMDKFVKLWKMHFGGLHCFVFGDQLASHVNENVTKSAMESGVFCRATARFLQVLDSFIFATLKNALTAEMSKVLACVAYSSFSEQALLFAAMYSAERVAFTKRVILASWRETGMYPVGEAKIRKLMDQNLHAHDTGQPVSDTHFDHMIAVAYGKVSRDREEGQGGRTARCLVGSSETVQGIPQHAIQPRRRGTKA